MLFIGPLCSCGNWGQRQADLHCMHDYIHTGVQCFLLGRCSPSGIDVNETQRSTHFVLTCVSSFRCYFPRPPCLWSYNISILFVPDPWWTSQVTCDFPGIYVYSYLRSLPPPGWVDDCLSSSASTPNVLLSVLLTGMIIPRSCPSESPPGKLEYSSSLQWARNEFFPCHQ